MNITYIIGLVAGILVFLLGIVLQINIGPSVPPDTPPFVWGPDKLWNFFDAASIFIVIGCTFAIVVASFPGGTLASIPKHLGMVLNNKKFNPMNIIDQLVDLAQTARKNGLLSLEEKANQQPDPFFKQAIMLIVDANDPDKVRSILQNDIECMSARHEDSAAMYDKASAVAPAFGMVGTLVGLINMLKGMDVASGGSDLGTSMGTALITTLYGCILAHMIFGPIANHLRIRDSEEVLCKQIIVEGIMSIQSGENPKFLREKLLTYVNQQMRSEEGGKGGKGGKSKGGEAAA